MDALPPRTSVLPGGPRSTALPALGGPAAGPRVAGPLGAGPLANGPRGARVREAPTENATLVLREEVSPTISRFVVRPDAALAAFVPGQYVAVGLRVDDLLVQRPYSTASAPRADAHELLVRLVPEGALTPHLWGTVAGARVRLGPPKGTFTLLPDDRRPHLFVASGTGLAPFVAMIRALAADPCPPRVVVVHGATRVTDLAYRDELACLARSGLPFAYEATVSRPADPDNRGWTGRTGRVEQVLPAILDAHGIDPRGAVAYLCGNPGMVTAARAALDVAGMPPADIHAEEFWSPTTTAPAS